MPLWMSTVYDVSCLYGIGRTAADDDDDDAGEGR